MNECPREADVLDALHASGTLSEDLRRHLTGCAACQELASVTASLLSAVPAEAPKALPSADFLWWKGQIRARQERQDRAERPMALAEMLGTLAPVTGGVYLLAGWAPALGVLALAAPVAVWFFRRVHHSE